MVKLMQPCALDYRGELSGDISADQQQAERAAMPPRVKVKQQVVWSKIYLLWFIQRNGPQKYR